MNAAMAALNAVAALAFAIALVAALAMRKGGLVTLAVKTLLAGGAIVYLFVTVSNVLEHGFGIAALDVAEDYVEILFIPLLVYTAHALYSRNLYLQELRSAGVVRRQYDLLLQILDFSPVGMLVVDDRGKISFASEGARRSLELVETADGFVEPEWELVGLDGRRLESGFGALCENGMEEDVHLYLVWPDRTRSKLLVSAAPMADRTGRLAGCVVALEDVQSRMAALGA